MAYSLMLVIGLVFSTAMVVAGLASSVIHPDAGTFSEGYWATIFEVLPAGARGLFVAALIAAVMSTVSADMLITGGILFYIAWQFVFQAPFGIPSSVATWIFGGIVYFAACFATYKPESKQALE